MQKETYNQNFIGESSQNINQELQNKRNIIEISLKMRAMSYFALEKSKLLTATIYEMEKVRKKVINVSQIIENEKLVAEEENKVLLMKLDYEKKINEQQEQLLWQQSKLAQVGEMMSMLTHQWKQPLSAIQSISLLLLMLIEQNQYNAAELKQNLDLIHIQSKEMFAIINDFMNFNKPDSDKIFYLFEAYEKAYGIFAPLITNNYITFDIQIDKKIQIFHNPTHLGHVLLNLLTNTKDAFDEKKSMDKRHIKIYTTVDDSKTVLHFEDNAGGIPETILKNIFEPYMTTKENGTGLGLWMSKKLIEKILGTSMDVKVKNDNTHFYITFDGNTCRSS